MSTKKKKSGIKPVTAEEKRIVFINEYLIDSNATRAAIAAGYSEKTAYAAGSRLLNHVEVQKALQARKDELAKTYGLVLEEYLTIWKQIAKADLRKMFDEKGALLPPMLWPDDVALAVEVLDVVEIAGGAAINGDGGVTHVPMYTKKIKLWNKIAALEKLTDMASGVHGKPNTAIQLNVNIDRAALTETRLDQLFGRYVPGG